VDETLANLANTSYVSLKTFRRNGTAVATPVWYAVSSDNAGYVFSAGDAGKVKRLRHSPQVELARCDVRGKLLGEWVEARGELVSDPPSIQLGLTALRRKYGWQMKLADLGSKLTGKYDRRAYIRITPVGQPHA
jgi:uncharacterized protein